MAQAFPDTIHAVVDAERASGISIVLVENHEIFRQGLKALIEADSYFRIVGEFRSAEECLAGIGDLQPDIIVTDLELPARSGVDLIGEIRQLSPRTRKLVLTALDDEAHIRAALGAGADGYILKDSALQELSVAIRTISVGNQFLCKCVASRILIGYLSHDRRANHSADARSITGRELEVLTRVALGDSNKLIARTLGVSPKTVEKHRSNLMRKLQLHNAAAITMYAIRHGLTSNDQFVDRPHSRSPHNADRSARASDRLPRV